MPSLLITTLMRIRTGFTELITELEVRYVTNDLAGMLCGIPVQIYYQSL